jgi:hypothetical protein
MMAKEFNRHFQTNIRFAQKVNLDPEKNYARTKHKKNPISSEDVNLAGSRALPLAFNYKSLLH